MECEVSWEKRITKAGMAWIAAGIIVLLIGLYIFFFKRTSATVDVTDVVIGILSVLLGICIVVLNKAIADFAVKLQKKNK